MLQLHSVGCLISGYVMVLLSVHLSLLDFTDT